jgi:acylphosphatase
MAAGEKTAYADSGKRSERFEKIKIEAGYEKARAHVVITGMVQGVFFRSTLRSQAKLLGVNGWTKNMVDGNVEAMLEGDKDSVEKMIAFCWKGPTGALVRDVRVEWKKPRLDLQGFEIRY